MVLDLVMLGQALGHPLRVLILRRLSSGSASVTDIAEGLGISHGLASFHLGRLFAAGLVAFRRAGRRRMYRRTVEVRALVNTLEIQRNSEVAAPPSSKPVDGRHHVMSHTARHMARGPSGKLVIEVDTSLKDALHARLAAEKTTMKQWFIERAEEYLRLQAPLPLETRYAPPQPQLLQVAEPASIGYHPSPTGNRSTR